MNKLINVEIKFVFKKDSIKMEKLITLYLLNE